MWFESWAKNLKLLVVVSRMSNKQAAGLETTRVLEWKFWEHHKSDKTFAPTTHSTFTLLNWDINQFRKSSSSNDISSNKCDPLKVYYVLVSVSEFRSGWVTFRILWWTQSPELWGDVYFFRGKLCLKYLYAVYIKGPGFLTSLLLSS